MAKKIEAPKTHKPSGGRPIEHLAYLNRNEMSYLMSLNGGVMSRGPKGLPSFAEETVGKTSSGSSKGSSSSSKSGGSSSGSSSSSKSSTSKTSSTSTTKTSSSTPKSQFSSSGVMMTDANGVQYDYKGNVIGRASTQSKSNSLANEAGYSTSVFGGGAKPSSSSQISGAISATKSPPSSSKASVPSSSQSPSTKTSSGTQKTTASKSSGATPSGSTSGPKVKSSSSSPTQRTTGMPPHAVASAAESFYKNDPYVKDYLAKERGDAAFKNAGVGDYVRGTVKALQNSPLNARVAAQGIGALVSGLYNDPTGTAARVAKSAYDNTIGLANKYMSGEKSFYDSFGNPRDEAVEDFTNIAANVGLGSSVASKATAVPRDALGSLAVGRSSKDPAIRQMFAAYDAAIKRGATPEQAFYESQRNAPSYAGGVVDLLSEVPNSPNYPVRIAQGVEIQEPFDLKSSGILPELVESVIGKKPLDSYKRYGEVFKRGPINESYPEVENMIVYRSKDAPANALGAYHPMGHINKEMFSSLNPGDKYNALKYGSTAINKPMKRDWAQKVVGSPDYFRQTAAHEGLHRVADVDARSGVANPIPQGTNPDYEAYLVSNSPYAQSMAPEQISEVGYLRYRNNPGETYARQSEDLNRSISQMRNYDTRFGNLTDQQIRDIMIYGTSLP